MGNIYRNKCDLAALDEQILSLCGQKAETLRELRKTERTMNLSEADPCARYRRAVEKQRTPVTSPVVIYQGEPGAYSEMACLDFFGPEVRIQGAARFEDTFEALAEGYADYAVLPIENSSTGAIRQVYDLLAKYDFYIVGETTVRVAHSLMVLPGARMSDIRTVYSHEQGLSQCEKYLRMHPGWAQQPQADTAGSAKMVARLKDPTIAAICSARAAEIYGLEILEKDISSGTNTTRFVVVSPRMELGAGRDKVCISLRAAHRAGSLHEVLTIFAVHGLNLVRLESRPLPDRNWEYTFFLEFTGNLLDPGMDDLIGEIADATADLRVLGNFRANL